MKTQVEDVQKTLDLKKNDYTAEMTTSKGPIRLRFLPDEVCELLRPITPGQDCIVFAAGSRGSVLGSGAFLFGHVAEHPRRSPHAA